MSKNFNYGLLSHTQVYKNVNFLVKAKDESIVKLLSTVGIQILDMSII